MPTPAKNALDLLMSSKKRKLSASASKGSATKKRGRSSSSSAARSSFVECPAGCGRHLPNLDYKINQHLDRDCSSRVWKDTNAKHGSRATTTEVNTMDNGTPKSHSPEKGKYQEDRDLNKYIHHHDPGNNIAVVNADETVTETSQQIQGRPTAPDTEGAIEETIIISTESEMVDLTNSPTSSSKLERTNVTPEEPTTVLTASSAPDNNNAAGTASLSPNNVRDLPAKEDEAVTNTRSTEEETTAAVQAEPNIKACSTPAKLPAEEMKANGATTSTTESSDNADHEDAFATAVSTPSVSQTVMDTSNTSTTARSVPETPDLSPQDTMSLLAKDMEILKNSTMESATPSLATKASHRQANNTQENKKEIPRQDNLDNSAKSPTPMSDVAGSSPGCSEPAAKATPADKTTSTEKDTVETSESNPNKKNPYHTAPKPTPQTNVFAHMMKQSSHVFNKNHNKRSAVVAADFTQHFILAYDMDRDTVSLNLQEDYSADGSNRPWEPPLWTMTVNVKDKQCLDAPKTVALTLSAVVAPNSNARLTTTAVHNNQQQTHRWVRYHSRLSVPVLKSMLQKSIRRRRPLPAVRVAMELMDKAFGELLRRLPIIILEDSTLHPDFALLVWMMVAHSKQFFETSTGNEEGAVPEDPVTAANTAMRRKLILALQVRILRIVYQIASCPHQDHLTPPRNTSDDRESQLPCISKPYPKLLRLPEEEESEKPIDEKVPSKDPGKLSDIKDRVQQHHQLQLSIWAMLVRAQYGGMACDVRMLLGFAQVWHDRMHADAQPRDDIHNPTHSLPPNFRDKLQDWSQLALYIHATGKDQSISRLPSANIALEKLNLTDICREGIDFHCSNLVDQLWRYASLAEACRSLHSESLPAGAAVNDEEAQLLLKRCIWKYSAGINLRRPLVEGTKTSKTSQEDSETIALNNFWKDVVAPLVTNYQTKYLNERLRLD